MKEYKQYAVIFEEFKNKDSKRFKRGKYEPVMLIGVFNESEFASMPLRMGSCIVLGEPLCIWNKEWADIMGIEKGCIQHFDLLPEYGDKVYDSIEEVEQWFEENITDIL